MLTEGNVALADGRWMTFAEYGSPNGLPVLYFHGAPSSRLEPLLIGDELFSRLGLRIVAPDRPGMGRSSFQAHRSVSDWPVDVIALIDALGIGEFSVLGNSGGGVYAAVCAATMPERLRNVVIVSGAWRMDDSQTLANLPLMNRLTWQFAKKAPLLLRMLLKTMNATAGQNLSALRTKIPPPDYDALESQGRYEAFSYILREALRQGTKGPAWDMQLFVHPLDIRWQDIHLPVHLFHGEKDTNVPIAQVRDMLAVLPTATLTAYPHDAHLSTLCNHFEDIAEALAQ